MPNCPPPPTAWSSTSDPANTGCELARCPGRQLAAVPSAAGLPLFVPGKPRRISGISRAAVGSGQLVARARTVAGHAIPGIIVFFFWVVVVILAIILLAFIAEYST